MRLYEALEICRRDNKLLNHAELAEALDLTEVDDILELLMDEGFSTEQILGTEFVATDRPVTSTTITEQSLREAWNQVRTQFTSVKAAEHSALFQALSNKLFRGRAS